MPRFLLPRIARMLFPAWLLLSLAACHSDESKKLPTVQPAPEARTDGSLAFLGPDGRTLHRIQIEIADTPQARQTGLMHRRSLGLNEGMLFIFDRAEPQQFWMRNTYVPLDILFVGADSVITNIAAHTTPVSDSLYQSTVPARFVVEVRAGVTERFGVRPGSRIRWTRTGS